MKIGVTILAAGSSKRMGNQNKLLLLVNNKPILYILCKSVLKADINQVVLVTGYQKKKIENVLPNGIDTIVHNEHWEKGAYTGSYFFPSHAFCAEGAKRH